MTICHAEQTGKTQTPAFSFPWLWRESECWAMMNPWVELPRKCTAASALAYLTDCKQQKVCLLSLIDGKGDLSEIYGRWLNFVNIFLYPLSLSVCDHLYLDWLMVDLVLFLLLLLDALDVCIIIHRPSVSVLDGRAMVHLLLPIPPLLIDSLANPCLYGPYFTRNQSLVLLFFRCLYKPRHVYFSFLSSAVQSVCPSSSFFRRRS